jgi:uncharacterized membrane protein
MRWLTVSVVLTILTLAGTLYVYEFRDEVLANPVPVHWDINGKADKTVPRDEVLPYLLISPGAMAAMLLLTLVLPWLSPKQFSIEPFRRTYNYIMALIVALFAYIQVVIVVGCLKQPPLDVTKLLIAGIFLFFALLGNSLGKVRRNFWMGVRTPWTLANETVWNQTHRLAAWLFVGVGVAGFVGVLAGVPFWLCFIALMIAAFVPVFYSLGLYKRLEKQGKVSPPAGSTQEVNVS